MQIISTPIEWQFIDPKKPVLLLGEWAKPNVISSFLNQVENATLPYHWENREKLYTDYQYIFQLYKKIIPSISNYLNTIHQASYSEKFWETIVGPWLLWFIQIFFDRYFTIEGAITSGLASCYFDASYDLEKCVPNDMSSFVDWIISDQFNYFLYLIILKQFNVKILAKKTSFKISLVSLTKNKSRIKTFLQHFFFTLQKKLLNKHKKIIQDTTFFNHPFFSIALQLFQKQYGLLSLPKKNLLPKSITANLKLRKSIYLCHEKSNSPFEKLLLSIIPTQIPILYIENFKPFLNSTKNLISPNLKAIINSTSLIMDDYYKFITAYSIEFYRSKLIQLQHGGGYGCSLWFDNQDYEVGLADYFISWGWSNHEKVVPLPSLKLNEITKQISSKKQGMICHVLWSIPRYSYHLHSSPTGPQFTHYLNDQIKFINNLSAEAKEAHAVRLQSADYGWNIKQYLEREIIGLTYTSNASFHKILRKSRLFIGSYNATTILETLAANFPSILFWDPYYWELSKEAKPFYDLLIDAEILHYSPVSAAKKTNAIIANPLDWWHTEKVQNARKIFCKELALTSKNCLPEWKNFLAKL